MPAGGGDMSHSRALAAHSWSQGTPVALGAGKKRRREDDNNDSDEVINIQSRLFDFPSVALDFPMSLGSFQLLLINQLSNQDSGYHPSPTGGARKKRVQADEDGVVGVIERVCVLFRVSVVKF